MEGYLMINIVKSHLYSLRCELLIKQGIAKGLIVPFDEEIYNKLDKNIILIFSFKRGI